MRAFLVLSALLIAAGYGLGEAKQASAGVNTISVVSATCNAGKNDVAISWPSLNQGTQWIYWSQQNNGWVAGTYSTQGPLAANVTSATLTGLPANTAIYVMVGTIVGGTLDPGRTMTFTTTACTGGSAVAAPSAAPHHMGFLHGACNLFNLGGHGVHSGFHLGFPGFHPGYLPFHGTFGPFHGFEDKNFDEGFFFDDEDFDDEDSDEDEDEDSDEDEDEDFDEDEDEDFDEDEDDEDEHFNDGLFIVHPGLLNICFPQHGPLGGSMINQANWNY
jgi:hypothetical protein